LPFSCAELIAHGMVILATDARYAFGPELRRAGELFSRKMREFLERGETGGRTRYDAAQAALVHARAAFDALFTDHDAILTLSATGEAPEGLATTGDASFNFPWTLLHSPALSLPGQTGSRGMPIGVQLLGPRHGDAHLLRIGRWAEAALSNA
jgi:amidase